jgi:hypothetical protein
VVPETECGPRGCAKTRVAPCSCFGTGFDALTLETTVEILDDSDVPERSVRLFRQMQARADGPLRWYGQELDEPAFRHAMIDQGRIIYQFDVDKAYGLR